MKDILIIPNSEIYHLLNLIKLNIINEAIKGNIICNNIWIILPEELPTTGTKRSAIKREDVKTQIKVIGRYFINSPASPGQKIKGIKAASVVAVEAIIGRAIYFEAKA